MKDRPPTVYLSTGPYNRSGGHLRDELARLDLLVRAQVIRWQLMIGAHKAEHLWGMVHVTEAEIAHYLNADVNPPDRVPDEVLEALRHYWAAEDQAAERIQNAVQQTPAGVDLRVNRLSRIFELTHVERDALLLCLLPEIDIRYRRIYGYLQDDASRGYPTAELLSQMLLHKAGSLESARDLFAPARALVRNRLVVLAGQEETRSSRFVRADDRIVSFLLGSDDPDPRVRGVLSELRANISWDNLIAAEALVTRLRDFADYSRGKAAIVALHGAYGSGKEKAARAIAHHQRGRLLRFEMDAALRDPSTWEQSVDLAFREARLLNATMYIDRAERLHDEGQPPYRWEYLLQAADLFPGITYLSTETAPDAAPRFRTLYFLRFDFPAPNYDLRLRIWRAALQDAQVEGDREDLASLLAASFLLTEGQVRDAVTGAQASARFRSFLNPALTRDDLCEACRRQAGHRLLGLARRIEPTRQLDVEDVIMNDAGKTQLRELLARIKLRNRIEGEMNLDRNAVGRGLIVLFTGPPGTGKTLSAEIIANQQGIDLYKVDVSNIVSKWLGETEKHLRQVFEEAEQSNALLFFDECDSLFGRRGETGTEASGRWANLQVNYLLQRIEEYSGVVILATNLRKNIDEAFIRRIQIIIDFPTPDTSLRFKLWKSTLPTGSLVSDEELRTISDRFALTGGNIRNASIDAAFRALANDRKAITTRDLLDGIAREYQKLAKPITQGEFGETFYRWALKDVLAPVSTG